MTTHISARVAWHDDGWNGRVCAKPAANTYCVGAHSYPGQLIAEQRNLDSELLHAGKACTALTRPPCCFSINAFGSETTAARSEPPAWWKNGDPLEWELPASSVCVWPYEQMYGEELKKGVGNSRIFDYDERLRRATEFFNAVSPGKSLVFYYANYSNPFSTDDTKRYILVGLSRVKSVGPQLFYSNTSEDVRTRYGGGFVWQRAITSHYPDQGLRLPYHIYRDNPEVMERLALSPENPRLCKYATRHLSDDDALGLVEGFLRVVGVLQEIGDTTEDWAARGRWLEQLVGELWKHRGLLPGMSAVLEVLDLTSVILHFKEGATRGSEKRIHHEVFAFLDGAADEIPGVALDAISSKAARREWKLRSNDERQLLRDVLPRFAIGVDQIRKILSDKRIECGVTSSLAAVCENPYVLSEQYQGDDPDDHIPWGLIDRGTIPSPELGGVAMVATNDARRLRGILVDVLRQETTHTFVPADMAFETVNRRLSGLPEWKRFAFHLRFLDADKDTLSEALHLREESGRVFLYLRDVHDDERLVEEKLQFMVGGPDIELRSPVTASTWKSYLFAANGLLATKAAAQYENAINGQVEASQRVFVRPLSVLAGAAGTGKTTVIKALVKAVKKAHGTGASVIALSPTGKAADRIREVLDADEALGGRVEVATLHSFLAKRGWLNPNLTLKRSGGRVEQGYSTYIVDEASMLDLALAAGFLRAVRWPTAQRLILVGDPNQLPPIGRGRVFADVIDYARVNVPESVATLEQNLRQLEGRVSGGGTGIIDVAQCFLRPERGAAKDEDTTTAAEIMLQRVQDGGDVDHDLRVRYWKTQDDLIAMLFDQLTNDLAEDIKARGEAPSDEFRMRWSQAFNRNPSYLQVLTPYRGEFFGFEELNRLCQERVQGRRPDGTNSLDGVMLFDKVIQVRNRPTSNPIGAWNHDRKCPEWIEIFNGQLGFVWPHLFDRDKAKWSSFRPTRFRVTFARRESYSVSFGADLGKDADGRWSRNESVEENLELAYAISVHKAQGSEFERTYVIVPKSKQTLLSTELFYTALTRARKHCTLLVEQDISPLLAMRRPESAKLGRINSSLFEFRAVPDELLKTTKWMSDGLIHRTLAEVMVRSKSEVIIANMLHERDVPFRYEQPLYAKDGTFYLPDFTVTWRGTDYYWEHLGLLHREDYRAHWQQKRAWYQRWFPGRLIETEESGELSCAANEIITTRFI